jgi:hypothetical protein
VGLLFMLPVLPMLLLLQVGYTAVLLLCSPLRLTGVLLTPRSDCKDSFSDSYRHGYSRCRDPGHNSHASLICCSGDLYLQQVMQSAPRRLWHVH